MRIFKTKKKTLLTYATATDTRNLISSQPCIPPYQIAITAPHAVNENKSTEESGQNITEKPAILISDIQSILEKLQDKPGALLPILHAIQDHYGFIPDVSVPMIADALNISKADVHGVITFYHFFRDTRGGKTTLHVCRAEACQANGSRELEAHIKNKLGIDYHQTTQDGAVSLEPVYCLGNCTCGSNLRTGDDIHARMTPERVDELLSELATELTA